MAEEKVLEYFGNCGKIEIENQEAFVSEVQRLIRDARSGALEQAADDLLRHLEPAGITTTGLRSIAEVRRVIMELTEMYKRCCEDRDRDRRLVATLQCRVDEWLQATMRAEEGRDGWIPFAERRPEAGIEIWICNTYGADGNVRKVFCEGADPILLGATHWKKVKSPLPPSVSTLTNNTPEEPPGPCERLVWTDDMDVGR